MSKKKQILVIFVIFCLCSMFISNNYNSTAYPRNDFIEKSDYSFKTASFSDWKWSLTQVVSSGMSGSSMYPYQAVDSSGNVHVVWSDQTNYAVSGSDWDIFYRRWNASSMSWTPIEVLSNLSTDDSYNPSLTIDNLNNVYVVWEDETDYDTIGDPIDISDIVYKMWDASSKSWTALEVVNSGSNLRSEKPVVAIDSSRNVHVVYVESEDPIVIGGDNSVFHTYFNFTSKSWSTPEDITPGLADSYEPSLTIDSSDFLHAVWEDQTNAYGSGVDRDIFYRQWSSTSLSWLTIEVVSTESTDHSQYPCLVVDSINNIHVIWRDQTNFNNEGLDQDIFYKNRNKQTALWTYTDVVSHGCPKDSLYPTIATDSLGYIHVAWQDSTNIPFYDSDYDIFYRKWHITSKPISEITVISSESDGSSTYPSIYVSSTGIGHVSWSDTTDYNDADSDWDIFFKWCSPALQSPILANIIPNPSETGEIFLEWNDVEGATRYYIFRDTYYRWDVDYFGPIDYTTSSSYIDVLPAEGIYFYVIVATDGISNSSLSNCEYVDYSIPHLKEFTITTSVLASLAIIVIVFTKFRKKK